MEKLIEVFSIIFELIVVLYNLVQMTTHGIEPKYLVMIICGISAMFCSYLIIRDTQ